MHCLLSLLLLCSVALSSCRSLDSESGLYDVKLEHSCKLSVDGVWGWQKGNPGLGQKRGSIYVCPIDIALVVKSEPETATLLRPQRYEYIVTELHDVFAEGNRLNHMDWKLAGNAENADIRTGELLMAVKDSNRENAHLYKVEAGTCMGDAGVNLRAWAHKLARLSRESFPNKLGNTTWEQKIMNMSAIAALKV